MMKHIANNAYLAELTSLGVASTTMGPLFKPANYEELLQEFRTRKIATLCGFDPLIHPEGVYRVVEEIPVPDYGFLIVLSEVTCETCILLYFQQKAEASHE